MADDWCIELGEHPSARRVNDALLELGSAMVKRRVIELLQSGLTRDQVNVILRDEITPDFNVWLRANYEYIVQAIHGDAPTHTVN